MKCLKIRVCKEAVDEDKFRDICSKDWKRCWKNILRKYPRDWC